MKRSRVNGHALAPENSAPVRPRGRPFPPGVSGNPGGRPKGLREFREAPESADGPKLMIQVLLRGLANEDVEVALAAYDRAAAYLYGRPGIIELSAASALPAGARISATAVEEAQRLLTGDG